MRWRCPTAAHLVTLPLVAGAQPGRWRRSRSSPTCWPRRRWRRPPCSGCWRPWLSAGRAAGGAGGWPGGRARRSSGWSPWSPPRGRGPRRGPAVAAGDRRGTPAGRGPGRPGSCSADHRRCRAVRSRSGWWRAAGPRAHPAGATGLAGHRAGRWWPATSGRATRSCSPRVRPGWAVLVDTGPDAGHRGRLPAPGSASRASRWWCSATCTPTTSAGSRRAARPSGGRGRGRPVRDTRNGRCARSPGGGRSAACRSSASPPAAAPLARAHPRRARPPHPAAYVDPDDGTRSTTPRWCSGRPRRPARSCSPGDVELAEQAELLGAHADLRADVLKMPHHGSRYSVPAFLDAVAPRIVLVSVGAGNRLRPPQRRRARPRSHGRSGRAPHRSVRRRRGGPPVRTERALVLVPGAIRSPPGAGASPPDDEWHSRREPIRTKVPLVAR